MTDTTAVVLSTIVYTDGNPLLPEILLEAHRADCRRVTADPKARIVSQEVDDPQREIERLKALVRRVQDEAWDRNQLAADRIRDLGKDPRLVSADDGREPDFVGFYLGRCLRGVPNPCFIPSWSSGESFGATPRTD